MPILPSHRDQPKGSTHHREILGAEEAIGGRAKLDLAPLEWNLHVMVALGSAARQVAVARKDAPNNFRSACGTVAAWILASLRCLSRDCWQYPDSPSRPRLPDVAGGSPGDVEGFIVSIIDAGSPPVPATELLQEVAIHWSNYMEQAELIRFHCLGEMDESALWMADPDSHGPDLLQLWQLGCDAAGAAYDLCARASLNRVLFCS